MDNVLRGALALIRGGWAKGQAHAIRTDDRGADGGRTTRHFYCAAGAMRATYNRSGASFSTYSPESQAVVAVIRAQFPERVESAMGPPEDAEIITSFNDHLLTTQADVEAVFEKAAIMMEEEA